MTIYLILFCAGLLGGFLAGLLGIGGGLIYIFALTSLFTYLDISPLLFPELTVANSIFAVFFASGAATITLIRNKEFYLKEVLFVTVGSILASILALKYLVLTSWYSVELFNVIIIFLLLYMLYRVFSQILGQTKKGGGETIMEYKKGSLLFAGVSGGLIAALSGLGGGVVIVPILHTYLKLDMKKTRSISLGVILITSFFMTAYNSLQTISLEVAHVGLLIPSYTIFIVLGVLLASPFGVKVGSSWSSKKISIIYSVFLTLFLLKKITEIFW